MDDPWALVAGQVAGAVIDQLGLGDGAGDNDVRGHDLPPFRVRGPCHGGLLDRGMAENDLLNFAWVHVEPAADDQLLGPAHDPQIAIRVEGPDVARAEPPVVEYIRIGD